VLVPSFALWLVVQVFDLNLWTTTGERWFFNPFAWQFLFVLGALFGHPATNGRMSFLDSPWLFRLAAGFAALIAVIQLSATVNALLPAVPSLRPDILPLDKTALQPLRLLSFFCLAVVARRVLPPVGALSQSPSALAVIRCGRYSLQVFSFGAVLSSVAVVSLILGGGNQAVQSLVCIAGIGAQLIYAAWRDRMREGGQNLPEPGTVPVPVRSSEARSSRRA